MNADPTTRHRAGARPRRALRSLSSLAGLVAVAAAALGVPAAPAWTPAALLAPGRAAAQDARTLFNQGQTAYRQGDYDTAVRHWTEAYRLDARPLLQYNLSQAYERLGRLAEAVAALETYLANAAADDTNQGDARARLAALRERLRQTGVRVVGGPEGATILVDGEDKGRTPRPDPIAVSPGSHQVVVRRAGYADFRSTVVVPAGQSVEVAVEMAQTGADAGGTDSGGDDDAGDGAGGGGGAGGSAGPGASGGGGSALPLVLTLAGGGVFVAGLGVGLGAFLIADGSATSDSSEAGTARTLALVADLAMGVGLVAAGIGLVLLLSGSGDETATARRAAPTAGTFRLSPWAAPTGGGANATIVF